MLFITKTVMEYKSGLTMHALSWLLKPSTHYMNVHVSKSGNLNYGSLKKVFKNRNVISLVSLIKV